MVITVPLGSGSPFLARLERRRAGVELAELLFVGAIHGREQHASRLVVVRKGDFVAAGADGNNERGERCCAAGKNDVAAECHGVSPFCAGLAARPRYFETAHGGCNMLVTLLP